MSESLELQQQQILDNLRSLKSDIDGIKEKRRDDRSKQIQQWALVVIGGLGIMFTIVETFKASINEISELQNAFMNRRMDSVEEKLDQMTQDVRQTDQNTQAIEFLRSRQDEWIKRLSNP